MAVGELQEFQQYFAVATSSGAMDVVVAMGILEKQRAGVAVGKKGRDQVNHNVSQTVLQTNVDGRVSIAVDVIDEFTGVGHPQQLVNDWLSVVVHSHMEGIVAIFFFQKGVRSTLSKFLCAAQIS